jgi:hypothetical protein
MTRTALDTRKTLHLSTKDKMDDVDAQVKVHGNHHNTWLMAKKNY